VSDGIAVERAQSRDGDGNGRRESLDRAVEHTDKSP
jgi:hypothetical protein